MSITIREGAPADAKVIAHMIRGLAASIGETSPITEDYAAEYLASQSNGILLADVDGRVPGMLSYHLSSNLYHASQSCMIDELFVEPEMRRLGIADALLSELIRRLGRLECAEVSVSTLPDNQVAIRFYRKHGLVDEALLLERHLQAGKRQK